MIAISLLLIWLAIAKGFEPLLLIPIGFGGILANIPFAGIADAHTDVSKPAGSRRRIA
jgi:Na+-transporting methylmalonyl-CoA/oxaloacetate decarboxylase beta subunit